MTWNVRQLAGFAGGNVPSISLLRPLYKRKCRTHPLVLVSLTEDILMFAGTTLMVSRLDADQDWPCWHPGSERLDELASPWGRRDEGEEDVEEEEEDEDDDEDDALGDGDEDLDDEDDEDDEDFDDEDEDLDDDEFDDEDFDDLDDEDEDFDELDDDHDDLDDDDDEDEDEDEAEESTGP
jgi:hypothetical protein